MTSRNYGSSSAAVPKKLVELVSGSGSNLQALLDACREPEYGAAVVAVGADRDGTLGLERAAAAGVPTFVRKVRDYSDREQWDADLTETVASFEPDLVISAGFLKLCGPRFLSAFPGRYINTHNSLLPAFPGMNGPGEALAAGVKLAGATLFICDSGVDTGPIIAQTAVPPPPPIPSPARKDSAPDTGQGEGAGDVRVGVRRAVGVGAVQPRSQG